MVAAGDAATLETFKTKIKLPTCCPEERKAALAVVLLAAVTEDQSGVTANKNSHTF